MGDTAEPDALLKKRLRLIRGLPVTIAFKTEFIEQALDYEPQEDDVIIMSYPKTGTTWISYIVLQILTRAESFPNKEEMLNRRVPFLELVGTAAVDALTTKPRVYKHHFPYNLVKKNLKAKMIYVYRRPEDTFVSYYHFLRHNNKNLDFDSYFEDFLSGEISYGSYFDHVLSFWKHKDDPNVLLVSYESLHTTISEEILRIAKFLGKEYYEGLTKGGEEILNRIIEHTSFDYMKKNLVENASEGQTITSSSGTRHASQFFRKGVVGDGKKSLNEDQLSRLKQLTVDKMKGTAIFSEWVQE